MTKKERVWNCLDEQYKIFIEEIPNLTLEQFEKEVKESRGYFSPIMLRKKIKVKEETFKKAKSSWVTEKKKELKPKLTYTLEQEKLRLEDEAKKLEIEERTKKNKSEELSKKMVRASGHPLFENEE